MKKIIISSLAGLAVMALLTGCSIALGTGSTTKVGECNCGTTID